MSLGVEIQSSLRSWQVGRIMARKELGGAKDFMADLK
jgi:hypothetical protein